MEANAELLPARRWQAARELISRHNLLPLRKGLWWLVAWTRWVQGWEQRRAVRRQLTHKALLSIEPLIRQPELLRYFSDRHHQEQAFFWRRFAPFLAVNTGAFAFLASTDADLAHPRLLGAGAWALAFFWLQIQWKSLEYVDLAKEPYFAYLRLMRIPWHHEPQTIDATDRPSATRLTEDEPAAVVLPAVSLTDRVVAFILNPLNSTRLAVWVSIAVLVIWSAWLASVL